LEIARERELIREGKEMATRKANALAPSNDEYGVRWAAPVRLTTRSNELGELESSILKEPEDLPFPKFYLQKEYNTAKDYENDKNKLNSTVPCYLTDFVALRHWK
jgi:hypothetical protein